MVKIQLIKMDTTLTDRESSWIKTCPHCQCEKIITYTQKWNLEKGKSGGLCKPCCYLLRAAPLKSLKHDSLKSRNIKGEKVKRKHWSTKRYMELRALFAPESLSNPNMRKKQSEAKKGKYVGEKASNWQGGKTSKNLLIRGRVEYRNLRGAVFKRDDYTCQHCLKRGGSLEMHHKLEFSNFPEDRLDPENCITLCKDCHKKTENYGGRIRRKSRHVR